LQICRQMFAGDETPYDGKHYQLTRLLNSPQPLGGRIPILIGGGGEKKTLRFVAKYADACNLFGGPEVAHKLDVLREHCEREGRDYAEIEKTVTVNLDIGDDGELVEPLIENLRNLAALGFTVGHGSVRNVWDLKKFEVFKNEVIPAVEAL
jgi:alkanesulfonate monooxygenase SsuD/methylene tetrahydromethanopterin reductase-like flavin-dependent oxidoreductase (luciferase family)